MFLGTEVFFNGLPVGRVDCRLPYLQWIKIARRNKVRLLNFGTRVYFYTDDMKNEPAATGGLG